MTAPITTFFLVAALVFSQFGWEVPACVALGIGLVNEVLALWASRPDTPPTPNASL